MQSWDTTKMVRSLLRHPEVNTAWNKILELKCDVDERFLCWPECDPLEVPLELDLGTITAERFVTKAFDYALKKKTLRPEDDTRTPLQVTHGLTGSALLNRNPNNDTTAVNNSDNLGMNSRMGVATMTRWNPSLERPDVPTSVPLCGYNSPQQSYGSVSAQGMMNNPIALHGVQIPSGSNEPSRNLGAGNHDRLDPDPYALHDPINDIPTGMDDLGPFAGMSYSEPLDFEPGTYSNEPFNFGDDNQDNVQH